MATLRELVTKLVFKVDRGALKIAAKLMDNVGKSAEEVAKKTEKAERAMKNISNVAKGVGLALTGAFVAGGIAVATAGIGLLKFNDRVKTTIAQIGILGGDMGQATNRFKEILAISQRTGLSFEEIAKLYGKVSMASADLGATNKDVMTVLETVAQAGVLSGTDAGSRNGALLQLGQAFGSAVVQAEEYNSVMDGLPKLHQEIAKSMGMSGAQLSRFIKDSKKTGGITGKQLFVAVRDASQRMLDDFNKRPLTLERVMNKVEVLKMLLGMDLKKEFKIPDAFLQQLDGAVDRMAAFVRENKDLIGLGIKAVFEGMSFALKAVESAIVGVVEGLRWISENKEIVKIIGIALALIALIPSFIAVAGAVMAIAEGAVALVTAFTYAAGILGVVGAIFAGLNLPMIAIVGALALMAGGVLAFVTNMGGFRDKTIGAVKAVGGWFKWLGGVVGSTIGAAINGLAAISNLKLPTIKPPSETATHRMNKRYHEARRAATTPPAGRAPARASGSGAGSKSLTANNSVTNNINISGGMNPARARQLGQGFAQGSINGFRALEGFGI